jgi:hypothetical protein
VRHVFTINSPLHHLLLSQKENSEVRCWKCGRMVFFTGGFDRRFCCRCPDSQIVATNCPSGVVFTIAEEPS